ncbi:HEAT repeat domain-containing protein [bacterium]|nr:HEAT repeat domain-containing protein [candidate division CSSED10-310 bacterium]
MKSIRTFPLLMAVLFGSAFLFLCGQKVAGTPVAGSNDIRVWRGVKGVLETVLNDQGRSLQDIEGVKWHEVPYNTIGRMPLIDTCLREPHQSVEIALWSDRMMKNAGSNMAGLMDAAFCISEEIPEPEWDCGDVPEIPDWAVGICVELDTAELPDLVKGETALLVQTLSVAAILRSEAFAGLSSAEYRRMTDLLPRYFVRQTPYGEMIRGYTTELGDCIELIGLLEKVDFRKLLCAARLISGSTDRIRAALEPIDFSSDPRWMNPVLFSAAMPLGWIVIGGTDDDVYYEDAVVLIDLGGDDVYFNRAGHAGPETTGVAVHVDCAGQDVYRSSGYAQGCALAGISVFMDFSGDDRYFSGHYSQGAALGGVSYFYDGGGDDSYQGDLGVQCFSIFGWSLFVDASGRDTYRCAAMGQGCASTLGVSILAEGGGDDTYRAGGKYGFYSTADSACAQGAASGMRPWPPAGKMTVYGGIGFLSESAGNDCYHAYIIGQGGSYVFALGMLMDSAGDDTYYGERYCRGVGVHLSAGVAVDGSGNDTYNGFYGNLGYSLDRSSGVFADFGGNDTYRTSGGIGFGHKPKGTGIFFDGSGDDTYAGWENNCGKADWPFGDEAWSTGFFVDAGGEDVYRDDRYKNNIRWAEGEFGYGQDTEMDWDSRTPTTAWKPANELVPFDPGVNMADPILECLACPLSLVRFTALRYAWIDPDGLLEAVCKAADSPVRSHRRQLIDLVETISTLKMMDPGQLTEMVGLLDAGDPDMRLLGLHALRQSKHADSAILTETGTLALTDPSVEVRGMACLTLGETKKPAAADYLIRALNDGDWRVRRRAAIALSGLRSPDAFDPLCLRVRDDPAFQVRAYAAAALGEFPERKAAVHIKSALEDPSEFVRCLAARTLLLKYADPAGMSVLIDLLKWENGPMKGTWVMEFLRDFTGLSTPFEYEMWQKWWATGCETFRVKTHVSVYENLNEARKSRDTGNRDKALEIYREIHKKLPVHEGMIQELSALLNEAAWEIVVSGTDIVKGLKLAEESVSIRENPMNLDTLAVLVYQSGDPDRAGALIRKAIDLASDADGKVFEKRMEEFETGKLNLR